MICLLPARRPHCLEEEVANDEEGDEVNDAVNNDDGDKDMPPNAKPAVSPLINLETQHVGRSALIWMKRA